MIQQFKNSFNFFRNNRNKWLFVAIILFLIIEMILLHKYPIGAEAIEKLLGHLLTFSSIVVAILITFIYSKIFQIRNEKLELLTEIKELSNKVTHFRRICRILRDSHQIWNRDVKTPIRNNFPGLSFFIAHDLNIPKDSEQYNLRQSYWDSEHYSSLAELYLTLDSFCLDENSFNQELWNDYNYDYIYRLEIIEKWIESGAANQIWYLFDYKYRRIKNDIDLQSMHVHDKERITELARKINSEKFNRSDLDRHLLADLGTDFDSYYLPRLYKKSEFYFDGLPNSLKFLIYMIFVLVIIGVLAPTILLSLEIDPNIKRLVSNFAILILCSGLFIFLYSFKTLLEDEIELVSK